CAAPTPEQKKKHSKTGHFYLASTPTFESGFDIVRSFFSPPQPYVPQRKPGRPTGDARAGLARSPR
ncbi:hypothetical protein, partial [Paraburkholderia phosphatilytica]|uniref:hypothetical protein n=1 Tax=Paraburkholderia phosphatilytica TaxID=2282883 RepID=UPI00197F2471